MVIVFKSEIFNTAFFLSLSFLIFTNFGIVKGQSQGSKPNIIFILTDDQSYDMLGCTGNTEIQTPHLDKLADEGVLFTNAHVTSAICTPSRVSIFLSQFERKHGVNFNSGTSVAPEAWENSYPELMRKAGYYMGYIGKNHAPIGENGYGTGLMEKSFDYWYAGHGHLSFYPKDRHKIFEKSAYDTQVEIIGEGIGDFLDNQKNLEGAVHFLKDRPKDQPFCLSVCFNLPHSASTSTMKQKSDDPDIYKSLYRDQNISLPQYYVAKADIKNPKLPKEILKVENRQTGYDFVDTPETLIERRIRQYQAVTGIDRLIGQLREKLASLKLDENTIIIFTSDHGLFSGEFGLGGKALCYEITTHVPMIIYNPLVQKKHRGKKVAELVQTIDIAPTMLAEAGIEIPASFQGKDLSGIVKGNVSPVREYLFTENLWSTHFGNPRCEAVQDKQWKYIRYYKNENLSALTKMEVAKSMNIPMKSMLYSVHDAGIAQYRYYVEASLEGEPAVYEELFHLENDPFETTNLINDPDHQAELERLRKAWERELKMARGTGSSKVLRYTTESQMEKEGNVHLE
ncbi:sulfatase-like hydrolase/transferase [Flexithrix dorotheae]|uniref:sulfatase-like hydrolase/transferase n=1 Tax=Flexithrix dorotheae TaxID=70993 RepID=UPI0003698F82|nr:sulfatase-like hydrolase/transferase [Flexithrix dorotheae]